MSTTPPSPSMRFHLRRTSDRGEPSRTASRDTSESAQRPSSSPLSASSNVRGMRRLEIRRTMEESHFLTQKARISSVNAPVDLRLLDYVGTYDSNLMCPICRCPFVDPVILYDCDHCFCRECLHQTWTEHTPNGLRGSCPTCRASSRLIGRGAVSKILVNILDDLLVCCPNHEHGCAQQLKRGEVQDHINLYCPYAWIACPDGACELPVRRKDAKDCLHHGVSCIDCHETTNLANLETHWKNGCPDRKTQCPACNDSVYYPPFLQAQKKRQDEQEETQKFLTRKIQVLEGGFSSLENLLYSKVDQDADTTDPAPVPFSRPDHHRRNSSEFTTDNLRGYDFPTPPSATHNEDTQARLSLNPDFPYPAPSDPYASPVNHLLSLHESLRDEMTRIATALHELDGRHSMLILNENLRLKEDMAYLGAQVSGIARQVGWLTSARLQSQTQASRSTGAGERSEGGNGEGTVQGAVTTAATALRSAARVVNVGREGLGLGRRTTDEGRTKL
ncbi:hypothetical protein MBLNU459_g2894t2 [Dothideomycetes sp. NU459]